MTKQEFIQEAALRLITAGTCIEFIASAAKQVADEVWKVVDEEQPAEPERPATSPESESVLVVANEIKRLEQEAIGKKNREALEKGWLYVRNQRSGLDIRFLNVCAGNWDSEIKISTVKELLDCGRRGFSRRKNMGPNTLHLVDQALANLYNITVW